MTSPDKSLLTYDKLMDELRRCYTEKKTCVAMISTKHNRLARIMFEKGNIIFLAYGSKHAQAAIPRITAIKSCRLTLMSGDVSSYRQTELPHGKEVLKMLVKGGRITAAKSNAAKKLTPDQVQTVLKIIEKELVEYLGPITKIICAEYITKAGNIKDKASINNLIGSLANEINIPINAHRFKKKVLVKIATI